MAGPFLVKHGKTRARIKIYAILFVCCATRAIDIEAVEEASAASCKMAFERHCSRYGCPEHVYSDQGSNFVGVNSELQIQYRLWRQSAEGWGSDWPQIEWRFGRPYSPRWNGHVEAMVRVFKKTLKELMNSNTQNLRKEEFYTLCTQAAGMMNRRPLVQLGSPGDREVLTPAHFLLGGNPYLGLNPVVEENTGLRSRKAGADEFAKELWVRLQKEYLSAQARYSAEKDKLAQKLQPGDLVLVLNEKTPVGLWAIATVLEARDGSDGQQRKFRLQLGSKLDVVRSATMLAPIRIETSLSNERLLYAPPKLRRPSPWERHTRALASKRERALKVLTTWAKHEEAKREYRLYATGRDPGPSGPGPRGRPRRRRNKQKPWAEALAGRYRVGGERRTQSL